ncbi:MAG: hypothetical protein B6D63_05245 [Candidatus Latescibacteria bacterium 4484_7]|nr:MAG: hypothetical protein B6D63_05245 [Candidatus Latescibacteria bacterium 4484_7]RKZ08382.1 MAG: hypothetical protein DRQ05_01585 [bacterium]
MQVKCNICGGINDIYPGERILRCEYCGNSLSIERGKGPEHLVLLHERDDKMAIEAATSFIMEKTKRTVTCTGTSLHLVPFVVKGNSPSGTSEAATSKKPFSGLRVVQPAGRFVFFEDFITQATEGKTFQKSDTEAYETIRFEGNASGALRIVHIPIYIVSYRCGNREGEALVTAESWQVTDSDLPPAMEKEFDTSKLILPVSLFLIFTAAGFTAKSFFAGALLVIGGSGLSYLILALRQRLNASRP